MKERYITSSYTPDLQTGFLGHGHTARNLIGVKPFAQTNPFFLLMDDAMKFAGGESIGSAHPHAGFETATLTLYNHEQGEIKTGAFELLTAGKGVIHTEATTEPVDMRILQLWVVLPKQNRWAEPLHQEIGLETVPTMALEQGLIRVYSGSSNGLTSPLSNQANFIMVDVELESGGEFRQQLPANYSAFIVMLEGELNVAETVVTAEQVAWFDQSDITEETQITVQASKSIRFVLYAGEPQEPDIVAMGPFIADNRRDLARLYNDYTQGKMPHLRDLPDTQKIKY